MKWEYVMEKAEDGLLLRTFLKERLRISTRLLTLLKKKENGILVNGERVTVRYLLKEGDRLTLAVEDEAAAINPHLTPVALPVSVLYEDGDVVVCHKPVGMPTHPSHGHREDTLANALCHRYLGTPFVFRAVNRLDRETGGAVAVARNPHAAALLSAAMREGRIRKEYLAWVEGTPPEDGRIDAPIRRKVGSVMLREVCKEGEGDAAVTLFRRLYTDGERSLIQLLLLTGRTHQIRVHMASVGHPLLGDGLYGNGKEGDRTMLHALRLSIPLPSTGDTVCFLAPPEADFSLPCGLPPPFPDETC